MIIADTGMWDFLVFYPLLLTILVVIDFDF